MHNDLDIVIPCFNEAKNIIPLIEEIDKQLKGHFDHYNLILIDDGSKDETSEIIGTVIKASPAISIKYLKFTRNFGKEIAVKCGIDHSTADYCAIMDADLQHPPAYLIKASKKMQEEKSSIVYISPSKRRTYAHQKVGAYGYKKLINAFSKDRVFLTDFSLLDRKAVNLIKQFNESDFYTRGILSIIGLRSSEIHYMPEERMFGKTKFSFLKLVNLAIDGVISVSTKPLRIAIYFGLFISAFSMLFGLYMVIEKLALGQPIPGFATMGFGMFFLGGIQILFLGIIGEYVGKTFIQSKQRPIYTIDTEICSKDAYEKNHI
jgi:polyisoprenyl-phosphate glycosyltransferase